MMKLIKKSISTAARRAGPEYLVFQDMALDPSRSRPLENRCRQRDARDMLGSLNEVRRSEAASSARRLSQAKPCKIQTWANKAKQGESWAGVCSRLVTHWVKE